jgi:riboflavin synthase
VYTGITRGLFQITAVERRPDLLRYRVDLGPELSRGLELGASVAIDGVCQTVVAVADQQATFEAIAETLRLTTLDALGVGQRVSVERSARVGDEIGGHELAGHVYGTGRIAERNQHGDVCDLRIAVPAEWMRFILEKGFVAVDGSSLTVGKTDPAGSFWLHLIPETLRLTNFAHKAVDDRVNIELDARTVAVVQTVERVLAERERGPG